jgi:hypothetical protein
MENYTDGAVTSQVKWVLNPRLEYKFMKLLIFQHKLSDKVSKIKKL